jgi:hypothetical protein
VAFPLASGFVLWLAGTLGVGVLVKKATQALRRSRRTAFGGLLAAAVGAALLTMAVSDDGPAMAAPQPANRPLGVAQGIHPGRVVWVHERDATDWVGPGTGVLWYKHIDQAVVDRMLAEAVTNLTGKPSVAAAWDALFRHLNRTRGRGPVGYRPGEKVAIKVNHTLSGESDPMRMGKPWQYADCVDNSPQLTIALLKQLTENAGVVPGDIAVGDPSRLMPNYWYRMVSETVGLEDVVYLTLYGSPASGRRMVRYSDVPLRWSDPDPERTEHVGRQDFLPVCFAEADYIINFAVLKTHQYNGVTLCAKNHYGSLIRNPIGVDPHPAGQYYNMHRTLVTETPGTGHYRCLVDLMGHPHLGGKTVLYLIDGLFAGQGWEGAPTRWQMEPFNGDWPNSIFVSQDPVAIDSVGYDFLRTEWPDGYAGVEGVDDYLHEAAQAPAPPSGAIYDPDGDGVPLRSLGVHEHWDNAEEKRYSRNLGAGDGIELIPVEPGAAGRAAAGRTTRAAVSAGTAGG